MNILIIDGYNIINQWPELKKELERNGLEHARNELIAIMSEYHSFTGDRVVVVFDGYRTHKPQITKTNELGVEVIFSKRHQTADSLIERFVYQERGEGKTILVASKDRAMERIIFGLDCWTISPEKLEDIVKQVKSEISHTSKSTAIP